MLDGGVVGGVAKDWVLAGRAARLSEGAEMSSRDERQLTVSDTKDHA